MDVRADPSSGAAEAAPDSDLVLDNPYPGLRPFRADEIHLYFGRDEQRAELLRRLREARFLAVIGGSGSGKSSLVRAGLLPGLHGGFMGDSAAAWRIADLRPGRDPIGNLVAALDKPGVLRDEGHGDDGMSFTDATLRRSRLGLVAAVREARLSEHDRVLVLVDQFEELFRVLDAREGAQVEDDANAFVALLLEAAEQKELPIYVVLTMRSDFLGECARFQGLPEAINQGQYLIPRLTREQRREVIAGPAAVHGAAFAPALLNRLLNDVGDNPDQLPLLQHALMRTWDLWVQRPDHGQVIELDDYERTGGMGEALSRHADSVLAAFVGDAEAATAAPRRRLVERVFRSLVSLGRNGRAVRRLATLGEIAAIAGAAKADVAAVVEAFRAQGNSFLMPPPGEALVASTTIDITHESLIRNWAALIDWYRREVESGQTFERLAGTAALHAQGDAGLWREPELDVGLRWRERQGPTAAWAARYATNFEQAMDFLDDSAQERARGLALREIRRRRRVALSMGGLAILVAVMLQWVAGTFLQAQPWAGLVDPAKADTLKAVLEGRASGFTAINLSTCWQGSPMPRSLQEKADGVPLSTSPFDVAMRYACDPDPERKFDGRRLLYAQGALLLLQGDFDGFQKHLAGVDMREAVSVFEQIMKVLDSDTVAILDEGRQLAAWQARGAAARGDPPEVRHPAHIAIRDALRSGRTLAPGKGADVLLKAYADPGGDDSVCNGKLFRTRDGKDEWTYLYRRMARDIACRPTLNISTVTAQMRPYALSLLMLLAWPIWKVLRWQQRKSGASFDTPAQPWRRAAAALFDGAFAGVLFGAVTLLASSVFDELLFRGLMPFEWIDVMLGVSVGIGALVALAYLLGCDALLIRHSRSLGKIAFDLRPVSIERAHGIDLLRSFKRNAVATITLVLVAFLVVQAVVAPGKAAAGDQLHGMVIFAVFLVLTAGYHWRPQSFGDRWSGTRVVDADSSASAEADALPRYLPPDARAPAAQPA